MAKKSKPVEVNITGTQQAATIRKAYADKKAADNAKKDYDNSRKGALPTLISKVFKHWAKRGVKHFGTYTFKLSDAETYTANCQNRQSTKRYDPADAKAIMASLNADCDEGAQLKPSDVYNVQVTHELHPEAMHIKGVRERILQVLTDLEAELKKGRTLPPEVSLIQEDRKLVLADHAVDRVLACSNDFEAAMKTLDNPVTVNLITSK